jgi:hypothetical protein
LAGDYFTDEFLTDDIASTQTSKSVGATSSGMTRFEERLRTVAVNLPGDQRNWKTTRTTRMDLPVVGGPSLPHRMEADDAVFWQLDVESALASWSPKTHHTYVTMTVEVEMANGRRYTSDSV